jgi:hypothetical protein
MKRCTKCGDSPAVEVFSALPDGHLGLHSFVETVCIEQAPGTTKAKAKESA